MNDANVNEPLDRWPSLGASIQTLLHTPLQPELSSDAKGLPSYGSLKFKDFLKLVDDNTYQEPQDGDHRRPYPESMDPRYSGVNPPNGDTHLNESAAPIMSQEMTYARPTIRNKEAMPQHPLQAPTNLANLTTEEVWNRIQQEEVAKANTFTRENYVDYPNNAENHEIENAMMESQRHQMGMGAPTTVEAFLDQVGVKRVGNGNEEGNSLTVAAEGPVKPKPTGRSRGRPKGSKNRTKKLAVQTAPEPPSLGQPLPETTVRRPRGRPKGSRNRNPKTSKAEPNSGDMNSRPLDVFPGSPDGSIGNSVDPSRGHPQASLGSDSGGKDDKEVVTNTVRRGRKRKHTDLSEAERKQRRMIKNRESAARSRDKRQAYTESLEERVNELQHQNHKLRSTVISVAHAARQLAEATIDNEPENNHRNSNPSDESRRYNLRRTRTGPW